jgi:Uncharacterised nucleotidyltransferase
MELAVSLVRYLSCPPSRRKPLPWLATLPVEAWEQLIVYIEARSLTLAAYHCFVVEAQAPTLPTPLKARLRRSYIQAGISVPWLNRELAEVCQALVRAGISPVVLKGPHLGPLLWPEDPTLRPFGDLDLWVKPVDIPQTEAVLRELNYGGGPAEPITSLDFGFHELPAYQRSGPGAQQMSVVDLHYRLAPDYLPIGDEEAMFKRATPWLYGAQVLAPEDLCVYLCSHVARHLFVERRPELLFQSVYGYLGEMGRLLDCYASTWSWDVIAERMTSSRYPRAMLLPLRLAAFLWEISLPENISKLWKHDVIGQKVFEIVQSRLDALWSATDHRWLSISVRLDMKYIRARVNARINPWARQR